MTTEIATGLDTAPAGPAASATRRIATMAAYGGGALGAAGAVTAAVLLSQAFLAKLTIPGAEAPPPRSDGNYPPYGPYDAAVPPLRMAMLGDSTAAGYGVDRRVDTPGAIIASGLANASGRVVRLICPAVVGAVSAGLHPQVEEAVERGVDVVVIMIGANDVTGRISADAAVRQLFQAVRTLRATGAQVVVGTCPDLGTIQPIRPPLRWLARRWSRQLAAAQTVAVVEAGGRTVSLGDLLGPEFAANPALMFGADRFHPSREGYAAAGAAILPTALAALGLRTDQPGPGGKSMTTTLAEAALAAAEVPGTEVSSTSTPIGTIIRGRIGRWAQLRRRPGTATAAGADRLSDRGIGRANGTGPAQSAPTVVLSQAEHQLLEPPSSVESG